jgi:hypothetical protein
MNIPQVSFSRNRQQSASDTSFPIHLHQTHATMTNTMVVTVTLSEAYEQQPETLQAILKGLAAAPGLLNLYYGEQLEKDEQGRKLLWLFGGMSGSALPIIGNLDFRSEVDAAPQNGSPWTRTWSTTRLQSTRRSRRTSQSSSPTRMRRRCGTSPSLRSQRVGIVRIQRRRIS